MAEPKYSLTKAVALPLLNAPVDGPSVSHCAQRNCLPN